MAWAGTARREHSQDGLRYPSDLTDREWALTAPIADYPVIRPDVKVPVRFAHVGQDAGDHTSGLKQTQHLVIEVDSTRQRMRCLVRAYTKVQ